MLGRLGRPRLEITKLMKMAKLTLRFLVFFLKEKVADNRVLPSLQPPEIFEMSGGIYSPFQSPSLRQRRNCFCLLFTYQLADLYSHYSTARSRATHQSNSVFKIPTICCPGIRDKKTIKSRDPGIFVKSLK